MCVWTLLWLISSPFGSQSQFTIINMDEASQKRALIAVIGCWRRNKCLWDPDNPNFHSIETRNKAYKSLLKLYRKLNPSGTLLDLKKKLKYMKYVYHKEYKKVKSYPCATGNEDSYVPKLWYYEHLLFLEKCVTRTGRDASGGENYETKPIRRNSKISNGDISMVSQQATQEKVSVQPHAQVSASTCTKEVNVCLYKQEFLPDNINTPETSKECEWEVIAKSIGLQLKKLDSEQQDFAQKLISDIIFYGKRGKLCDSTSIMLEPHHPSHLGPSQFCDPLGGPNCNSGVLPPQSIWYSPHTPSSSISSPSVISSPSDYRFASTMSQKFSQQPGTQPALVRLGTPLHHTHVEQPPISIEVTASLGMKQEEIFISDDESTDDHVFSSS